MKPIEFRGKETMSYNKTEQPTAEGAEEITAEEFIREKIRQKFYVKGEMLGLWTYLCNGEDALRLVHEFATLHAQRIAEKMVSERDEIAIKALETINHAYYTEGESAEEQVIDLRSIALKALEEIDNIKTK